MFQKNYFLGFTLIELLIVVGILSILATATLLVINPVQLVKQSRDGNRIAEINQLNGALLLYQSFGGSTSMGTHGDVYVSLPSAQADCSDLGLPVLSSGQYHCSDFEHYRNIDGNGWIPVNLSSVQSSAGTLFSSLPIDPVNTVANGYYYTYIPGSWALSATLESDKYLSSTAINDGGVSDTRFELGNNLALDINLASGGGGSSLPSVPQTVVATADSSQVVLTWVAPLNDGGSTITNYEIYRGSLSDPETFLIEVGDVLTYSDTTINPATSYFYEIAAKNANGIGNKSGIGTAICSPGYTSTTYGYNSSCQWVAGGTYKYFNASDNASAGSSSALGCQSNTTVCSIISGFNGCSKICPSNSWISGTSVYCGGKYWYSSWYSYGSFPSVCYYNCNRQTSCACSY